MSSLQSQLLGSPEKLQIAKKLFDAQNQSKNFQLYLVIVVVIAVVSLFVNAVVFADDATNSYAVAAKNNNATNVVKTVLSTVTFVAFVASAVCGYVVYKANKEITRIKNGQAYEDVQVATGAHPPRHEEDAILGGINNPFFMA